ncbi:MAG: hypothetical protein ACQET5_11610 [Halobacteriota archaeon]|uniref:DUF7861 family protein n=1 Tax=Natronomonas sp. TaxID=2184060 RepID=UPI003975E8B9
MHHDRIHARRPSHHVDRWSVGRIESIDQRDGHCVVTVRSPDGEPVELVVTFAVRDLFLRRLETNGGSPVGERVWYRKRGEGS